MMVNWKHYTRQHIEVEYLLASCGMLIGNYIYIGT